MQTLLFHKFIRPMGFKVLAPVKNDDVVLSKPICPSVLPFYSFPSHLEAIDRPYKIICLLDYQRHYVCVCTDIYPLNGIFWKAFYQLEVINNFSQQKMYWFIRNQLNGGKDFVSDTERVGSWISMFKHFFKYRNLSKLNDRKS